MTDRWLRGSYVVAPASGPAEVVIVIDEATRDYAPIDVDSGAPGGSAIEVRATEMGPTRSGGTDLLTLTAIITDLSVNLTASAIWASIVTAVHSILRARRPKGDKEQRVTLTVVVQTQSGEDVFESEAVGEGAIDAGLAAFKDIVTEAISAARVK